MTRERWQDSEKVKDALANILDRFSETGWTAYSSDGRFAPETPQHALHALCSAVADAVSVPPEAARRSKAENLLLGLHKIVADLAPYFDKPLTDDTIPRWLALDSAQKAIAEYFEEEEEGEELSNPDHDPAVFKHAGTDGRSYYDV